MGGGLSGEKYEESLRLVALLLLSCDAIVEGAGRSGGGEDAVG